LLKVEDQQKPNRNRHSVREAASESSPPSKVLTGPRQAPTLGLRWPVGLKGATESPVHLLEMGVARENVVDAEVLHDDHTGEIDEGNVRLVVVLLPHPPGQLEVLRGNMHKSQTPRLRLGSANRG